MKTKKISALLLFIFVSGNYCNGAILSISNVNSLTDDRLYADLTGTLMNNVGQVTIGYFTAGITSADVDTIPELFANLGNFTIVSTSVPGTAMLSLSGAAIAGYADNTGNDLGIIGGSDPASIGQLTTGNALIGRNYYSIVTNAINLGSATLASQYALVLLGVLPNEDSGELAFTSNPNNIVPLIGTVGSFTGDIGFGTSTYSTLRMEVIPEPSTLLLSTIGVLALLRRKR